MAKKPRAAFDPHPSKSPVAAKTPTVEKIPRAMVGENPNKLLPAWRLSSIELVDPYGWHALNADKLREIHKKISEFERLTWNEILVAAKDRNHSVPTSALCKTARDRLNQLKLDDLDTLVSLRLSGAERVWGIRTHNILTLLWWDPEHQVYPSALKNT